MGGSGPAFDGGPQIVADYFPVSSTQRQTERENTHLKQTMPVIPMSTLGQASATGVWERVEDDEIFDIVEDSGPIREKLGQNVDTTCSSSSGVRIGANRFDDFVVDAHACPSISGPVKVAVANSSGQHGSTTHVEIVDEDRGRPYDSLSAFCGSRVSTVSVGSRVPHLGERFRTFVAGGDQICIPRISPSSSHGKVAERSRFECGYPCAEQPLGGNRARGSSGTSSLSVTPPRSHIERLSVCPSGTGDSSHTTVNAVGLSPGVKVILKGLVARAELNGKLGVIVDFDKSSFRWRVFLDEGASLRVKADNIEPFPGEANFPACQERTQGIQDVGERSKMRQTTQICEKQVVGGTVSSSIPGDTTGALPLGMRFRRFFATGDAICVPPESRASSSRFCSSGRGDPPKPIRKNEEVTLCENIPSNTVADPNLDPALRLRAESNDDACFAPGTKVVVKGLSARPDLNGQSGEIIDFDVKTERWRVVLNRGPGIRVKSINITRTA